MVQRDSSVRDAPESRDAGSIPIAALVESIVGCKWSVRLLQLCAEGHARPSAFLRACPGLSAKVMNERLRKMIRFGIVRRTVFGDKPPIEVEYRLTPFGRRFLGIVEEVRKLQDAIDRGLVTQSGTAPKAANRRDRLTGR
jgi:DNA-binding HxlR family transcriptional regulator